MPSVPLRCAGCGHDLPPIHPARRRDRAGRCRPRRPDHRHRRGAPRAAPDRGCGDRLLGAAHADLRPRQRAFRSLDDRQRRRACALPGPAGAGLLRHPPQRRRVLPRAERQRLRVQGEQPGRAPRAPPDPAGHGNRRDGIRDNALHVLRPRATHPLADVARRWLRGGDVAARGLRVPHRRPPADRLGLRPRVAAGRHGRDVLGGRGVRALPAALRRAGSAPRGPGRDARGEVPVEPDPGLGCPEPRELQGIRGPGDLARRAHPPPHARGIDRRGQGSRSRQRPAHLRGAHRQGRHGCVHG